MRKLEKYRKKLTVCGDERNSYARTDHSATFMRLKRDCMGNEQLLPAYNIQALQQNHEKTERCLNAP